MVRFFARHSVTDYVAWRSVYDAFDHESLGVRRKAVYRSIEDPNNVTICHDPDDRETAIAFATSEELKAGMIDAGVVGDPNIWIADAT